MNTIITARTVMIMCAAYLNGETRLIGCKKWKKAIGRNIELVIVQIEPINVITAPKLFLSTIAMAVAKAIMPNDKNFSFV